MEKLIKIQGELKSPKNQRNQFGKYNYRSCEDILEAVKPLLIRENLLMNISDEMVEVGGRVYCKATVTVIDDDKSVESCGWAREAETQKGMADAQITGSSSSYARKYGLNAMYLIDDTKDDDFSNKHGKDEKSSYKKTDPIVPSDDPFEMETDRYLNHPLLPEVTKDYIRKNPWTPKLKKSLDEKIKELENEVTF